MCYTEKAPNAWHRQGTPTVVLGGGPVVGGRDKGRSWVRFRVPPWISNTIAQEEAL